MALTSLFCIYIFVRNTFTSSKGHKFQTVQETVDTKKTQVGKLIMVVGSADPWDPWPGVGGRANGCRGPLELLLLPSNTAQLE